MRLIDADAFLKEYCEPYPHIYQAMSSAFKHAPKVDAVLVIRCRDCKHCRRELAQGKWEGSCRYWNTHSVMLNDFCSYGERKDNEDD